MSSPLINLAISIISFAFGFSGGYIYHAHIIKNKGEDDNGRLVIVVVTLIWAASVAFEMFNPLYKTNPLIHGLMGSVVGYFIKDKFNGSSKKDTK